MMTSVLAGTARDVAINIYDKWNNDLSHEDRSVQGKEAVNIVLRVSWDQAKLVISNSTTSSLENIVKRLKEFVLQQKRRSERTFLLMWPENVSTALSVDETDSKNKINNSGICTGLYVQGYMYRVICTGLYVQGYMYRAICTGLYVQGYMYRAICTGLYVQGYMYRAIMCLWSIP